MHYGPRNSTQNDWLDIGGRKLQCITITTFSRFFYVSGLTSSLVHLYVFRYSAEIKHFSVVLIYPLITLVLHFPVLFLWSFIFRSYIFMSFVVFIPPF